MFIADKTRRTHTRATFLTIKHFLDARRVCRYVFYVAQMRAYVRACEIDSIDETSDGVRKCRACIMPAREHKQSARRRRRQRKHEHSHHTSSAIGGSVALVIRVCCWLVCAFLSCPHTRQVNDPAQPIKPSENLQRDLRDVYKLI